MMRRKRIRIIAIFFAAFMLMLYTPSIVTATGDVDDMSDEGEDPPVEEEDESWNEWRVSLWAPQAW